MAKAVTITQKGAGYVVVYSDSVERKYANFLALRRGLKRRARESKFIQLRLPFDDERAFPPDNPEGVPSDYSH